MRRQIKEPIVMRRVMAPSSVCICLLVEPSCCSHIESFSQSDLAKDGTWTCMASSNLKSQLGMPANGSITSSTVLQKGAEGCPQHSALPRLQGPCCNIQPEKPCHEVLWAGCCQDCFQQHPAQNSWHIYLCCFHLSGPKASQDLSSHPYKSWITVSTEIIDYQGCCLINH